MCKIFSGSSLTSGLSCSWSMTTEIWHAVVWNLRWDISTSRKTCPITCIFVVPVYLSCWQLCRTSQERGGHKTWFWWGVSYVLGSTGEVMDKGDVFSGPRWRLLSLLPGSLTFDMSYGIRVVSNIFLYKIWHSRTSLVMTKKIKCCGYERLSNEFSFSSLMWFLQPSSFLLHSSLRKMHSRPACVISSKLKKKFTEARLDLIVYKVISLLALSYPGRWVTVNMIPNLKVSETILLNHVSSIPFQQ